MWVTAFTADHFKNNRLTKTWNVAVLDDNAGDDRIIELYINGRDEFVRLNLRANKVAIEQVKPTTIIEGEIINTADNILRLT